ncbi:MAG: DUF4143 domain-containing protein [Halioglobus sp.]|nr:DUF4143 domain-containing protein [Halioglobus sp.]
MVFSASARALADPVSGKSWEGFVVENLHSVLPNRTETYFYRTAAGAEIDLVINLPSSETWAVEIKHGVAPKIGKHYSSTCDDVGAVRKYIVYGGDDEFPVGNDVTVISLAELMAKLQSGEIVAMSVRSRECEGACTGPGLCFLP